MGNQSSYNKAGSKNELFNIYLYLSHFDNILTCLIVNTLPCKKVLLSRHDEIIIATESRKVAITQTR